jgi:RNA polymerase sigma-70 factor (ECF subfamily)
MAEDLDDLTLVRAQAGDASALSRLVAHHQRAVFALVARVLCGRAPTEDVAQEVFIRVLRGIGSFDPRGPAKLSTWILTIATRTSLNALRGRPRELPSDDVVPDGPHPSSPEQTADERQRARRVWAAMATLPEDARAVLVMRAYHDLDYPEIAAALELQVGTVKSRLARARVALRACLAKTEKEPT